MYKLNDVCVEHQTAYVITHECAAQHYAPFPSSIAQVRCRVYPNAPLSLIARQLNETEVCEGGNWEMIESKTIQDMALADDSRGFVVQSEILAYLDLRNGEGPSQSGKRS